MGRLVAGDGRSWRLTGAASVDGASAVAERAGRTSSVTVGVPLDGALAGPGDGEGSRLDVVRHDRPGGGVGAVAEGDGRDERRVHPGLHARPDGGAVLDLALVVVVGGDRRGGQ